MAGKRSNGRWATVAWLVSKDYAHTEKGQIIMDHPHAKALLKQIRRPVKHFKGDIFRALPARNIPEREKPTPAMLRALRKAQKARAAAL